MTFQVRIQNLGKLADATVRVGGLSADPNVGGLTVLAGVNGTGKSFFSKALYSVLDAANENSPMAQMRGLVKLAQSACWGFKSAFGDNILPESLGPDLKWLAVKCVPPFGEGGEIAAVREAYAEFAEYAMAIVRAHEGLPPVAEKAAKSNERSIGELDKKVQQLRDRAQRGPEGILSNPDFFVRALPRNLRGNFQASDLAVLKMNAKRDMTIHIEGEGEIVGQVVIAGSDNPQCDIRPEGLLELRSPEVIFLESPALWRLKGVLEKAMLESRNGRTRLDVPGYFRDLLAALLEEYSGEIPFPKVYRRLTEEVIRGKIEMQNESGKLLFAESGGGVYPLTRTATGVVPLGFLALLIERKLVDKGTFLFIDEPESNLHPAWQVEMVRALFALARGGVNVVMATHSVDIVKYLEVHAKENPEDKNLIALNHFTHDGVTGGDADFEDQLSAIQAELTRPFHKLYMRGL